MKNRIRLSIVTICKNNPFDVIKTSFSLRNIRRKSLVEWVVIDGSDDGRIKRLLSGISDEVNYINETDKGIYDAFNKGIDRSNGKYILFLNSGDTINESIFFEIINEFNSERADMLFFGSKTYYKNINFRNRSPRELRANFHSLPCSHQSMAITKKLLNKYKFNCSFDIAGDLEIFFNIVRSENIKNLATKSIDKPIINFSIGGTSTKKPLEITKQIFFILRKYEKSKITIFLKTIRNLLGLIFGTFLPFFYFQTKDFIYKNLKNFTKKLSFYLLSKSSDNNKIVVASNDSAGLTMLFLEIQKSFIKENIYFSKILLRYFKNKPYLEGPCGEFLVSLEDLNNATFPIIKTHSTPHENNKSSKYIFVYSDPLSSAISVYNTVLKEGIDFYLSHLKHLNSIGLFERIFHEDTLNYEKQLTKWKRQSDSNLLLIKLPEIWSRKTEIEDFLGFRINLPAEREQRKLADDFKINSELFKKLNDLY